MARSSSSRAIPFTSVLFARRDVDELRPELPPIEKVASDLRRLHRLSESLPKGTSFVRSIGVLHAYDQLLDLACRQLEVPTRILSLPDGKPRMLERLRLEYQLGECGLVF